MRAIVMHEFGSPDVLVAQDVPDPVAGPGQLVIAVAAASITLIETRVRAGGGPPRMPPPVLPMTPGNGVGGEVIAVGDGVERGLLGARVVSTLGGRGGYAERALVDAAEPIAIPDGLGVEEATALLADGRTALGVVRGAQPRAGESALVLAAAGGVGGLLVQLLAHAGVRVVAAAGAPAKLELAAALGADSGVDYTQPGWSADVGTVDMVFDGVGGAIGADAVARLADGGRLSAYGIAGGAMTTLDAGEAQRRGLSTAPFGTPDAPEPLRDLAAAALREAAAGRLRATIGQRFALADAAAAHAAIEARATRGKTLLIP